MVNKKRKRKLNKKRVFFCLFFIFIVICVIKTLNTNITNIYISGNNYYTDQEIIDIAKLTKYPKSITNIGYIIEKRLEKDKYILKAKIKKNILLNKVYIEIEENYPLFYYLETNKTILYDGTKIDDTNCDRIVINSVPEKQYNKLIESIKEIDLNILNRISEIKYEPIEKIKDRFVLYMTDGNYVSITLKKFNTLNKYLDIVKYINTDSKGIIKLDSGQYFDEFDE